MSNQLPIPARHAVVTEDLAAISAADLPWSELDGAVVLVTGANGFVPAYLIEAILYRNEISSGAPTRVVAVARNESRATERFAGYLSRDDFRLLIQDVTAPIQGAGPLDFIVHAASQASPKYYKTDPVGTHLANSVGTYNLLKLASESGARGFLFVSSGDVYGDVSGIGRPADENTYGVVDPMALRSCYAEGKRAGENLSVCWYEQFKLPTKVVRLSHTYGPGMRLDDGRVFADFVACAVAGKDIVMTSDGRATRPFCYLADTVRGLLTILLKGKPAQAYNLANDEAIVSIAELASIVASVVPDLGIKPVFNIAARPADYVPSKITGGVPDTTKIRSLGWRPTTTIAEGFRRTIETYRNPTA